MSKLTRVEALAIKSVAEYAIDQFHVTNGEIDPACLGSMTIDTLVSVCNKMNEVLVDA